MHLNGFDVCFSYDSTKIKPSSMQTNQITKDETEYYKSEKEFEQCLEFFTIPDNEDVVRGTLSFNPPVDPSDHIKVEGTKYKIIPGEKDTENEEVGELLLGKMSFQMTADEFSENWFKLKGTEKTEGTETTEGTKKPIYFETGIEVDIGDDKYYIDERTFKFTNNTASKDASLSGLVLSSGVVDEESADNSTYKEYKLTPTFNSTTLNYEVTLLEYLDTMDIKATLSDAESTMKIKVPKKDEDGNLVYEEKDLQSDVPFNFTLNKLGEPDTVVTVIVTAEDGKTTNEYELVIKRPFGIIKGQIETPLTKSTTGKNISNVRIYKSEDTKEIVDWVELSSTPREDDLHEQLLKLKSMNYITNDDGTYEIYVVPGQYDILLDKSAYLDQIYALRTVAEGQTVDLGYKELVAGDTNKDGVVQLVDLTNIVTFYGTSVGGIDSGENYDFDNDKTVALVDLTTVVSNFYSARKIEI